MEIVIIIYLKNTVFMQKLKVQSLFLSSYFKCYSPQITYQYVGSALANTCNMEIVIIIYLETTAFFVKFKGAMSISVVLF